MRASAFSLPSALILLAIVLKVAGAPSNAGPESYPLEGAASPSNRLAIELFGCISPFPSGYILRTDVKPFLFYRADGWGRITIRPYKPLDRSELLILNEEIVPPITIVEWTIPDEVVQNRASITTINDGKTEMAVSGPDVTWAVNMARRCAEKSQK